MLQVLYALLSIIGIFIIFFLFRFIDNKINKKTILFSPILMIIMLYVINLVTSNTFVEMFGSSIDFAVFSFCFFISCIYVVFIFEKITESTKDNNNISALIKIGMMAASSIIFYSLIYLIYYRLSGYTAFVGVIGNDLLSQAVSFLYFSVVTFATVGFGDIQPVSSSVRLTVILEIILGFITVIYGISSFFLFKERFQSSSSFGSNKINSEDSEKK